MGKIVIASSGTSIDLKSLDIRINGQSKIIFDSKTDKILDITLQSLGAASSTHSHTKSQITDFPASLPANGGNADTVDDIHAWQMSTLSSGGNNHGTVHTIVCQHNYRGDGRFFFRHKDDQAYQLSIQHSVNSDNLAGLPWSNYVTGSYYGPNQSAINAVDPQRPIIADQNGGPLGNWTHFISMPHANNNAHTAQILIPFFNNPTIYTRSAPGGDAGNFGNLSMCWMSHNSNACQISSGAPGDGRLLWAW